MFPLYLIFQLSALTLAASRIPLSAHYPQPIERLAAAQVLIAQITTAALLFPVLLRDWRHCAFCVIAVCPMLCLAALLGENPPFNIAVASTYVILWLTTLTLWRQLLLQPRWQYLALAIITLWTFGGPVLSYLHAEYGSDSGTTPWTFASGPLGAALAHLHTGSILILPDLPLLLLFSLGFARTIQKIILHQQVIHELSTNKN
jgi:hypothetical protein